MAENFLAPERYETERFTLRAFEIGDGSLYAEARNESFDHCGYFKRWAGERLSEEACEAHVRRCRARYLAAEEFALGIFSPCDQSMLGEASYFLRMGNDLIVRSAAMNMWIRSNSAGQGLGSAVLGSLVDWGFAAWPWDRLMWICDERNSASNRIAVKADTDCWPLARSSSGVK